MDRAFIGEAADRDLDTLKDSGVLLVCLAIRHGGVDVRIIQTARALAQLGIPYRVAVIEGAPLHASLRDLGLAVAPIGRRRSDPRIVFDLMRLAREFGLSVIDAHNTQSQFWSGLVAVAARIPARIATVHSVYREEYASAIRCRMHESALRLCARSGFRFVCVSSNVQRYLIEVLGIPQENTVLSRNGLERLEALPVPADLRAEAGWAPDAFLIAMIGRLYPRKGHRFLLEALRELAANGDTRPHLFIAGTGGEEGPLRDMVARYNLTDRVHFAGFRQDVTSILAAADLLCLPSTSEGLPYVVLEAARQGVPVLASRLEGTDDTFVDGETILFTPARDVEALGHALARAIDDPAMLRRIGSAAHAMFEEKLGAKRAIDETLAAYETALVERT
nr:glycosyltransferase family 4 protein [Tropicimonas marinistellae]